MTETKKRVRKPITKEQSKITMDKYRGNLKADNWIRPYCTIPGEYRERFNNMVEDMATQGRWDRRAKAECKVIGGMPTNVWYHARNVVGEDHFVVSSMTGANNGWGLFPSKDAVITAWNQLTDEQKEAVADETSNRGIDMSEKKDTFTLFGVELGTCEMINNRFLEAIQYWDFRANEIGKSLGLIDSHILEIDLYDGEIISFDEDNNKTPLNHTISLCMNVPVTGAVGE